MIDERTNEDLVNDVYEFDYDDIVEAGYLTPDAEDALAELLRRANEVEKLRELAKAAHIVARMYGETLCQGNEGGDFLDAVDALFPKEVGE